MDKNLNRRIDENRKKQPEMSQEGDYKFEQNENDGKVTTITNKDVRTLADLVKVCKIDTKIWLIERYKVNKWNSFYRSKDRTSHTIVPLFQVTAWLKPNSKWILATSFQKEMIREMKTYSPKYPTVKYKQEKDKHLLIPDMPDLHLGKLAWGEESGQDQNLKIIQELALDTISDLINKAKPYPIDKIMFPLGNDYFNVNSKENTTEKGTPQQEDDRWRRTFKIGRQLAIKMIDMLTIVAPVEVKIIPGNHDLERIFYMGDSLECWYSNSKNVIIDNSPKNRKYYLYGKVLIGLSHGYWEKLGDFSSIMPLEVPTLWAKSTVREFHLGDKHHKVDRSAGLKKHYSDSVKTEEIKGVTVRILRSLTATDQWHYDKGFIGNIRGAEAFIYHPVYGLQAQYQAITKE
jgi:hypothetical protein